MCENSFIFVPTETHLDVDQQTHGVNLPNIFKGRVVNMYESGRMSLNATLNSLRISTSSTSGEKLQVRRNLSPEGV